MTADSKSTLLLNLIRQDVRAGHGVALFDPHGDLYEEVLRCIPASRARHVVLINPTDSERCVGINFLECSGPNRARQAQIVINELLKCFERLYDMKIAGGPAFELYFRNALLLLMEDEGRVTTLMDVPRLFSDADWREELLAHCKSVQVRQFWNLAKQGCGEQSLSNFGPYISNKLNRFTQNALLRPILGQAKSTISFRRIMDERKILLVNLSKGTLGEGDSQFLGLLLFGKLCHAAMSRADLPPHRRPVFHWFVDEFQNFTTDTVNVLLAETRKYGLALTLANQTLGQIPNENDGHQLLDCLLGNVGSLITFRMGVPDSKRMEDYFQPDLTQHDLRGLPNFCAAARLMTYGGPTSPFLFHTLPTVAPEYRVASKGRLLDLAQTYTRPASAVEKEIVKHLTSGAQQPDGLCSCAK